jgi:hypothetical protein
MDEAQMLGGPGSARRSRRAKRLRARKLAHSTAP